MKATEYERQNTVLRAENATLREQLKEAQNWGEPVAWCWMDEEIGFGLPPDAVSQEATLLYARRRKGIEVQKTKAEKHYELGTEYFDLYTKAEREIAGLQKLLKRSATYIVDYPLSGQRDRIFLDQIDAALNKIDVVITATGEEQ